MMRTKSAMMLALAGLVAAACDTNEVETDPGLLPDQPAEEQPQDMMVARSDFQPTAEAGELNVSGWAEFHQRDGTWNDGMELRVHLMGLSEGDHAWHIHQGTCEAPGQVVLPLSDFGDESGVAGDLNAGDDGMVEETVNIDRDRFATLNLQDSHVIAVHLRGGDDPGPVIACAPVELRGGAMGTQPGTQPTTEPGTTGY
ncbi:MAG TPA: hypothetical protein VK929_02940 [Longimicrobiales bacterium]|nr:hypothetical protein [Longimicrobiales bacterium]